MPSSQELQQPSPRPRGRADLFPRLAATRQLVEDRQRAEGRLRRALWASLLAHALIFLVVLPLSRPQLAAPPPITVQRIELEPDPALELETRPEPQSPQPAEPRVELAQEQPPPQSPPAPPPQERLQFVPAHAQASDANPDATRISTQDQRVDHERVSPARARIADGAEDRGVRAGTSQQAARAGSTPQQPAPATEAELQATALARRAAAAPEPPRAVAQREDDHPCATTAGTLGPCDAAVDTRGLRQGMRERGERTPLDGPAERTEASHVAASSGDREGWNPIAIRLPGQVADAQPFPDAPLPDRPSSPGQEVPQEAQLQPLTRPLPRRDRQVEDLLEQRQTQAHAQRQARPQGSSLPDPNPVASELESLRTPAPEPELRFDVEPLDLMRQEREREQQAKASEQNTHRDRRRTAQGSARPTAASPTGSLAAAGGSVVTPIEPLQALDVHTMLATRTHPLAGVMQVLDDQLRASWSIPFEIRVSGIVGTTGLELVLDQRGRIRDVVTTRPSGHPQLDALARDAIPDRLEGFAALLQGEAREAFPPDGLRVYYEFEYRDSPVAGVL